MLTLKDFYVLNNKGLG